MNAGLAIDQAEGLRVHNNLWYGNEVNAIGLQGEHDHNWFANNLHTEGCSPPCALDPDLVAGEANGQLGTADPFVAWAAGDFRLAAPTVSGLALEPPLNRDAFGVARGADGTVDRGAYEQH